MGLASSQINPIPKDECVEILQSLDYIIFTLNEDNFAESIESTMKICNTNFPYSFNYAISRIILISFISQKKDINLYLEFIKSIEQKEEEIGIKLYNRLIKVFTDFILTKDLQESYYILEKMIERNLANINITKNIKSKYFAQYKTEEENKTKYTKNSIIENNFIENYEELSKNDFELHKKLIDEGINPNRIAKVIRNDNLEELQEISSQEEFDYNQYITPSLYEICSFINKENVTLIEYASFFGSIKCFKYLLMNGSKLNNAIKYAIVGGNIEIIHLCVQNQSSSEGLFETAIEYHKNDVIYYISENKLEEVNNLTYLGIKCVTYDNYEYLLFLEKEGMEVNNMIINEAVRNGNALLVMYFLEGKQYPQDYLFLMIKAQNIEFIDFLLNQKGFDINMRDIILLCIMLFHIIF